MKHDGECGWWGSRVSGPRSSSALITKCRFNRHFVTGGKSASNVNRANGVTAGGVRTSRTINYVEKTTDLTCRCLTGGSQTIVLNESAIAFFVANLSCT